jgi:hypothetical protein
MTETNAMPTPQVRHPGLVCRACGCRDFRTIYTRPRGDSIVRRKRCRNCDRAISTREKIA